MLDNPGNLQSSFVKKLHSPKVINKESHADTAKSARRLTRQELHFSKDCSLRSLKKYPPLTARQKIEY